MMTLNLGMMAAGFALVIYSAIYRGKRQNIMDPAIRHIVPTGLACLGALVGSALMMVASGQIEIQTAWAGLAWMFGTGLLGVGMLGVGVSIYWFIPDIAKQPTQTELVQVRLENEQFKRDLARVRMERELATRAHKTAALDRIQSSLASMPPQPAWIESRGMDGA